MTKQTPIHKIMFILKYRSARNEIMIHAKGIHITWCNGDTMTASPRYIPRLRITPVTAAVAKPSKDIKVEFVCDLSTKGAPMKIRIKDGRNV